MEKFSYSKDIETELLALIEFFEDPINEKERIKYGIIRSGGIKKSKSAFIRKIIDLFEKRLNEQNA